MEFYLLKGSEVIGDFSKLDTIVFDKTGTLTLGNPSVEMQAYYGDNHTEALSYLASIERESDHPLAKAILKGIGETTFYSVYNTKVIKGGGITASVNGHQIAVGNVALMYELNVNISEKAKIDISNFEKNGSSLVLTAVNDELKVLMGIRDQIRPNVKEDLKKLKKLGIKI